MAIFTPGPVVGRISGSIGSNTFSHNKGGPYIRNRSIPTLITSQPAQDAKARVTAASQAWGQLTAPQRLQWETFAENNTSVNALGQTIHLSGAQWYNRLNIKILNLGEAQIDSPPIGVAPLALTSMSITADIGAGTFAITFAATPLAGASHLWVEAAVVDSPGITYLENKFKLIMTEDNAATALDYQTELEARFGTAIVGHIVTVRASVVDDDSGLQSNALQASATVVTT